MITPEESQKILQPRAQEVLREYRWKKFDDFVGDRDEYGHNMLFHCQELENNYRRFVTCLVGRTTEAWPPRISSGHLNPFRNFKMYRQFPEHEKSFLEVSAKCEAKFSFVDGTKFFYQHLGDAALNVLVRLLELKDEGTILLPIYWPEAFGNRTELKRRYFDREKKRYKTLLREQGHPNYLIEELSLHHPVIGLDDPIRLVNSRLEEMVEEKGRKNAARSVRQINTTMIKKIPRFPPEVHEFRVQGLEDAVVVLNSLYDVGVRLSKEQGYKMTVKAN